MIYHVREFGYNENYVEFFKDLSELKEQIEKSYPGVSVTLMYNLDGERGKVHILSTYSSMDEYEKINDQMDKDEKINEQMMKTMRNYNSNVPLVDHFFKGIS